MAQTTRNPLDTKDQDKLFEHFKESVSLLAKKPIWDTFLESFFTPTEKSILVKRLYIGMMLLLEYSPRQIMKTLRVSSGTVNAIRIEISKNTPLYTTVVEILGKDTLTSLFESLASSNTKRTPSVKKSVEKTGKSHMRLSWGHKDSAEDKERLLHTDLDIDS